jgi:hypothetical protein
MSGKARSQASRIVEVFVWRGSAAGKIGRRRVFGYFSATEAAEAAPESPSGKGKKVLSIGY